MVFMAGHVMNFFRAVRRTKQFIAEGKIGKGPLLSFRPERLGGGAALG